MTLATAYGGIHHPSYPPGLGAFWQYADTLGTGLGTTNAAADYSGGGIEEFYIQAQAGESLNVERVLIYIEDGGSLRADHYGALGTALGVGVVVQKQSSASAVIEDMTNGLPIKNNAQWGQLCFDVNFETFGAGNNFVMARWTFGKTGFPLTLRNGEKLVFKFNDNLAGLVQHTFNIQGIRTR
jgi:hypothetical protein